MDARMIDFPTPPEPADDGPPLTCRTIADIPRRDPAPLLLGLVEPEGPTLIYGAGGVGKGSTCAWLTRELLAESVRPLIYDAEGHPEEWRARLDGLGVDGSRVGYIEPHELPAHLLGRPLHDVVPHLGDIARHGGYGMLVVDSILAAANLSEDGLKSDAAAPYRYTAALGRLGIPSVSIGHTPKQSPNGDPYGSVSWINAMRLTLLATRAEGDGHRVRLIPRKRNQRGRIAACLLTFAYDDASQLCGVTRQDDDRATRDRLLELLANGPQTVEDLAEAMIADDDGPYQAALDAAKETVRKALNRMRRDGRVHRQGQRRPFLWALGDGR